MGIPVPRAGSGEMNFLRIGLWAKTLPALVMGAVMEPVVPQLDKPHAALAIAVSFMKSRRVAIDRYSFPHQPAENLKLRKMDKPSNAGIMGGILATRWSKLLTS
jgi:hypothetical protein